MLCGSHIKIWNLANHIKEQNKKNIKILYLLMKNWKLMPSPSAFSKFVLSVLKFVGILKFLRYTQNILGILKWANLYREI